MPIKGTFLPFYKGGGLGCLAFVGWACLLAEAAWFLIHPSSWEIPFSIARCSIAQLLTTWVIHACYWMWGPLTIWTRPPRERFLNIQSKHEFKVKRVMNLMLLALLDCVSHPQLHHSLDSKLTTSSSHYTCHPSAQCSLPCWNTEAAVLHELRRFHCAIIFCP